MYAAWSTLYRLAHAILHAEYDGQRCVPVLDFYTLVQSTSPSFLAQLPCTFFASPSDYVKLR